MKGSGSYGVHGGIESERLRKQLVQHDRLSLGVSLLIQILTLGSSRVQLLEPVARLAANPHAVAWHCGAHERKLKTGPRDNGGSRKKGCTCRNADIAAVHRD